MREALFKCVRSDKILYCCEHDDGSLDYGCAFVPSIVDPETLKRILDTGKHIRNYPPKGGYYDTFVRTHSSTMKRLL